MSIRRRILGLVLGRRRPVISGESRITGLDGPITIRRDQYGIPMIEAGTDGDAAFAIGFCQGQDRTSQLDTLLRIGRGTLAELVGAAGLPVDRLSRRIGFHRAAVAQLPVLDADVRLTLERFAAGVTAGHTHGLTRRPHEYIFLGGSPHPWSAVDVLTYLKLSSFLLPSNWDVELARLRMIRADGEDAMGAVDPTVLPNIDHASVHHSPDRDAALSALTQDLALFEKYVSPGGGSNNWVVAGSRTASGKPIIANDPHLAPHVPPPWYLVQVRTTDWSAAGATFAGAPAIIIGHNGFAAWGVTAGLTDNTDLFLEKISSDGTATRSADGTYIPCLRLEERIRVKGKPDVVEQVRVTPRGPVISPLFPDADQIRQTGPVASASCLREAISIQAIWLEPRPLRGFFDAPRANSFESFRRPFAKWPALPANLVYADNSGETGWQLVGQLPKRRVGHGTIPLPADAPDVGWESEPVPFDAMPFVHNPAQGYYATANEKPHQDVGTPQPFLGVDFIDSFRGDTIRDELAQRKDWDVDRTLALQMSTRSLPWEQLSRTLLALTPSDPDAVEALKLLAAWDGRMAADSPAAGVFEHFLAELSARIARSKLPKSWKEALGGIGPGMLGHSLFSDRRFVQLIHVVKSQPNGWFDRPWPDELSATLAAVVKHLRQKFGPGPQWWAWGHIRPLHVTHAVLGKSRLLGGVFNLGPVAWGGDSTTISQASVSLLEPSRPTHNMANLRAVFDTADFSRSRVVLCGGQSGNPCSAHYDDLFPLWLRGESIPLPWHADDILRSTVATLRLTPIVAASASRLGLPNTT